MHFNSGRATFTTQLLTVESARRCNLSVNAACFRPAGLRGRSSTCRVKRLNPLCDQLGFKEKRRRAASHLCWRVIWGAGRQRCPFAQGNINTPEINGLFNRHDHIPMCSDGPSGSKSVRPHARDCNYVRQRSIGGSYVLTGPIPSSHRSISFAIQWERGVNEMKWRGKKKLSLKTKKWNQRTDGGKDTQRLIIREEEGGSSVQGRTDSVFTCIPLISTS